MQEELHRLVELIQPESTSSHHNGGTHHHHDPLALMSEGEPAGGGGSKTPSPRNHLFPAATTSLSHHVTVHHHLNAGTPGGGTTVDLMRISPGVGSGRLSGSTASSSPDLFAADGGLVYGPTRGGGGGSDGGGEGTFSANDFVETYMDGEETRSSAGVSGVGGLGEDEDGEEYPDDVYTDSEDEAEDGESYQVRYGTGTYRTTSNRRR